MANVSVIIPCFNRRTMLPAALDSVLAQTEPLAEIIVVDDGSTDGSQGVVRQYAADTNGLVQLIEQENAGPSAARNRGLAVSRGDYVAFLDADDLWMSTKIAKQLALLQAGAQDGVVAVYNRMFMFRDVLDDLGRPQPQNQIEDPTFEQIMVYMGVQASTVLIDGPLARSLRFDETTRHAEDAIYFAQVRLSGRWRLLDTPLTAYRVHDVQATAEPWHAVKHTQARADWLERHVEELGAQRVKALDEQIWRRLIATLEKRYWKRELDDLDAMRKQVMKARPALMKESFLGTRRLYPRWVYRLRDRISQP